MNSKKIIVLLMVLFSFEGFSQKEIIKSKNDYIILNAVLERYFEVKKFSDSLFYNSDNFKANSENRMVKPNVKRRKERDTLRIKIVADMFIYKQFLEKDAFWRGTKSNQSKLPMLNKIFSEEEIIHYNKQIADNNYLWDVDKIRKNERVFFDHAYTYTRDDIKSLAEEKNIREFEIIKTLKLNPNLYTFSKIIYSINNRYALIARESGGTRVLNVFEKSDNGWELTYSINNNIFISRIIDP